MYKRWRLMKKALIVLSILTIVLWGCAPGGVTSVPFTPEPVPAEYAGLTNPLGPQAAADGAGVFNSSCKSCHGPEGHGDGPASESLNPHPKNIAELQPQVSDDYLFWRIAEGK